MNKNLFNKKYFNRKNLSLVLSIWIAFVFIQSLFFKFSGAPETVHIFTTIGNWMSTTLIFGFLSGFFIVYGAYTVGIIELIASGLLLRKKTRLIGSYIALLVIIGAIFFHLFTPLGIDIGDGGVLFMMAISVLISSISIIYLEKNS